MNIEEIKANIYREDIMIAAVTNELAESTVYSILNGTRTLRPEHLPVIATLEELAEQNIAFWQNKERQFNVSLNF